MTVLFYPHFCQNNNALSSTWIWQLIVGASLCHVLEKTLNAQTFSCRIKVKRRAQQIFCDQGQTKSFSLLILRLLFTLFCSSLVCKSDARTTIKSRNLKCFRQSLSMTETLTFVPLFSAPARNSAMEVASCIRNRLPVPPVPATAVRVVRVARPPPTRVALASGWVRDFLSPRTEGARVRLELIQHRKMGKNDFHVGLLDIGILCLFKSFTEWHIS